MQAQLDKKVDIRSYRVRTEDGSVYRRNRRHLRRTQETPKTKAEELREKVRPDEPTRAQTKAEELPDKVCSDENTPPSITPTTVEQRPASGPPFNNSSSNNNVQWQDCETSRTLSINF